VKELIKLIQEWIDKKKVGSLQINFFKGGISSVNMIETKKMPKQE
jgi:hypothetical protein